MSKALSVPGRCPGLVCYGPFRAEEPKRRISYCHSFRHPTLCAILRLVRRRYAQRHEARGTRRHPRRRAGPMWTQDRLQLPQNRCPARLRPEGAQNISPGRAERRSRGAPPWVALAPPHSMAAAHLWKKISQKRLVRRAAKLCNRGGRWSRRHPWHCSSDFLTRFNWTARLCRQGERI
jgi:hypothetical protein